MRQRARCTAATARTYAPAPVPDRPSLPRQGGRAQSSLLVADAGHHQIVELALDGETVIRRIGTGARGRTDGPAAEASFAEPNGLALLPAGVADFDVIVADTANHVLRGVRLADGAVVAHDRPGRRPDDSDGCRSGVTVAVGRRVVARHRAGRRGCRGRPPAAHLGSGDERRRDPCRDDRRGTQGRPGPDAWLAQPSGLAVGADRLWFVDSETSALRYLDVEANVHTVVGEGSSTSGTSTAPQPRRACSIRSASPVLPDGSVAISDTYNGAIRRYDPATDEVSTLAVGPGRAERCVVVDGDLVVVESAAHRLVRPIAAGTLVHGDALRTAATGNRPGTRPIDPRRRLHRAARTQTRRAVWPADAIDRQRLAT